MLVFLILLAGCHQVPLGDSAGNSPPSKASLSASVEVEELSNTVLARRFLVETTAPVEVWLRCASPSDDAELHELYSPEGDNHVFELFGLLSDLDYVCALGLADGTVFSDPIAFTTRELPFDLPRVEIVVDGPRYGAYTLLNHWRFGDGVHRLMVFDRTGALRWYTEVNANTGGIEASLQPDGTLLVGGGKAVAPGKMSLGGEWQTQMPPPFTNPIHYYHHEATTNPHGHLVGLAVMDYARSNGDLVSVFSVSAFDPETNEYSLKWTPHDALSNGTLDLGDDFSDPFHANAVQWIEDELGAAVWVSLKGNSTVIRIDPTSGEITHTLGARGAFQVRDADGSALGEEGWFRGQHAPRISNGRLMLYNNGGLAGQTEVVQYRMDLVAKTLTREWRYTRPGWFEPYYGEGDWLPNGNIMVASGHCNNCAADEGHSFVAEVVQATGEVSWEMKFPNPRDGLYRAQLIDGCDLFANQRFCES